MTIHSNNNNYYKNDKNNIKTIWSPTMKKNC